MSSPPALTAFKKVWSQLFTSPIHLDSALSKQPASQKTFLARTLQWILLRPVSGGEKLGVGVSEGEPWSIPAEKIAEWRSAELMAGRLWEIRSEWETTEVPAPMEADFPPRMIDEWKAAWGPGLCGELVQTLAKEPPLGLRVSRKFDRTEVLKELSSSIPVRAALSDFAPLGIRVAGYAPVLNTPSFKKGAFEIQDEGSQIMALFALWPEIFAPILTDRPGKVSPARLEIPTDVPAWNVVDACAGAGGKTLALADALGGKGRVYAYDTSAKKLQALRRRATRAGLNNVQSVEVTEGEEEKVVSKFRHRADVVLVDAPCTGWGVLRRNPDIKWRQTPEVLKKMPEIQKRILSAYSELVAPGGRLVFGVCTFRKAETVEVAESFLSAHPDFEKGPGGFFGPGPCDGFFMQAFHRKKKGGAGERS